ncbi:MAG TPA: hypothetical protein VF163_22155 [Micromonosporaceae bacterium]
MDPTGIAFRLRAVPVAVFADLLREAGTALDASALKQRLVVAGVEPATAAAGWRRAQPGLRRHANVAFDPVERTYQWTDGRPVPPPSPRQALDRLLTGRPGAAGPKLIELVRAALDERDQLEARLRGGYQHAELMQAAQRRQLAIDAARGIAELAMEVEELAATGAEPAVLTERVRALAKSFDLEPIGRAGERVGFDPRWHVCLVACQPGTPVSVIRPGFTWRYADQTVLIAKAQVASAG